MSVHTLVGPGMHSRVSRRLESFVQDSAAKFGRGKIEQIKFDRRDNFYKIEYNDEIQETATELVSDSAIRDFSYAARESRRN